MNTAIISDRASNSGVGFAVPINQHGAGPLLGELRGGKVTRGVIGVQIGEVPSDDYQVLGLDALRGVIVSTVAPDAPADEAGIEPGDVIAAYAGEPVEDSLDLQRRMVGTRPGTGVAVDVVRNGEPVTLDVTIDELNLDVREPQRDGGRGRGDQRGLRHHPAGPDVADDAPARRPGHHRGGPDGLPPRATPRHARLPAAAEGSVTGVDGLAGAAG